MSQAVYETLRHREKYMGSFNEYVAETKHGEQIPVYQLLRNGNSSLNQDVPSRFREADVERPFSELVAFYVAHSVLCRNHMIERKATNEKVAGVILLYFRALDSLAISKASEIRNPVLKSYEAEVASFSQQYDYYNSLDLWVKDELGAFIIHSHLADYYECFEAGFTGAGNVLREFRFVNADGQRKLKEEWPQLWVEFELGQQP